MTGSTYTQDAKLGDGVLGLNSVNIARNLVGDLGRREGLKELAELLLLVVVVRRVTLPVVSFTTLSERRGEISHISMGHGLPLNQSGIYTLNFCLSSHVARISAPCSVWSKKPKMSMMTTIALSASFGPVTSASCQYTSPRLNCKAISQVL
jgi:hypothetical protein